MIHLNKDQVRWLIICASFYKGQDKVELTDVKVNEDEADKFTLEDASEQEFILYNMEKRAKEDDGSRYEESHLSLYDNFGIRVDDITEGVYDDGMLYIYVGETGTISYNTFSDSKGYDITCSPLEVLAHENVKLRRKPMPDCLVLKLVGKLGGNGITEEPEEISW